MRLQPSRLALMAAAAITLSTAAVAVAQVAPPPGPPPMTDHGPGGQGGWGGGRHHRIDPEARAQHLRDVLQLRADQDGALKAYLAASGPRDGKKDGPRRDGADGPRQALTTPERLDRMQARMDERRAEFTQNAAATKRFYAALSPSQQKAFDALGPMGGKGGHGKMDRRGGGHHGRHGAGAPG